MPQIEIATMPPLQRGASRLPVLSCRRCVRGERLMAFVVSRDGRPTEERRPHEQLADAGVRGRAGVPPAHLFVSLLCAERTFCCSAAGGGGQPGRPYLRANLKQVSVRFRLARAPCECGPFSRAGVPPAHLFVSALCARRTLDGVRGQPGRPTY